MSARKIVAKNTLIQIVGKVITASSTLLVMILVTRHFGPAGFGDFTIMITFPTLFWIMADFGFNATVIREISKDKEKTQRYFSNLLLLRFAIALFFTILALIILHFLPYSPMVKLGASLNLGTLFMMSLFSSSQALFQANLKYSWQVLAQILAALFNLGLVFIFICLAKSLLWVALSSLFGNFLLAGVSLFFVRYFVSLRKIRWEGRLAKSLFLATLPIGLALIFDILDVKVDTFMLSVLPLPQNQTNSAAVGYYGSAFKIFEVILTIPFFFMSAVYPILVRRLKDSRKAAEKLFSKSLLTLLGLSVLAVLCGEPLVPFVIRILAGPQFGESILALRILLLALPVFFMTSLFMHSLLAMERQRVLPWIYASALVLNLVLNSIFIPRYSFIAAATITGITETFILSCLACFAIREFRV